MGIRKVIENMRSIQELELEDFLADLFDGWVRRRRGKPRRRRGRRSNKRYEHLKAEEEKKKERMEKTLQKMKDKLATIAAGVKMTLAQMEEELNKRKAFRKAAKEFGETQGIVKKITKCIAAKEKKIKELAAKC